MIRQAKITEYEEVKGIDPFSGDRKEDIEEGRVYIYLKGSVVAGFIVISRSGLLGRPYVQYLAVSTSHQRRGIASELLLFLEKMYQESRLFISTESTNARMLSLLSERNYRFSGEICDANLNGSKELYFYKGSSI